MQFLSVNIIFGQILQFYPKVNDTLPPSETPKGAYGKVKLTAQLNLLSGHGRKALGRHYGVFQNETLPTFEYLGQRSGFVLYETNLNDISGDSTATTILQVGKPRDRIYVYLNGVSSQMKILVTSSVLANVVYICR